MAVAALGLVVITSLLCVKLLIESFFSPGAIPALCVLVVVDTMAIRYVLKSSR